MRCTLSPARWLQMMASRTSLSARASMMPAPAWSAKKRLGEAVHPVELELHQLLLEQRAPALFPPLRQRHGHGAGIVAHAERVGGKLEIAEQVSSGAVSGGLRPHV